ncbi:MAG: IS1182 family transposase [Nitrospinaceae bacterium]|jgi:transposase|nr:IS1182 family transposase [Nitrospinaceae bacterium]MEE1550699.1 IS1182 family transposase [Nitrospinaceae bacterium]|tara:strand:- start:143 stop:1723 length:1581 start_codon:yes stop_codon:yes gene_type:complete
MMSKDKTHVEIRNENIDRELFEITGEMRNAMERARMENIRRSEPVVEPVIDGERNNFRPYDQNQDFFVTVSKNTFLEEKHPACIIDLVVERLDLTELYEQYFDEGNPAYHPKMMLKVLFYAYYVGIMSSRTIWDCVINRADFMYLAAGQVPNFRTINAFRLRHIERLGGLFTQIVMLCKRLGMIGFKHLAIDGQKIHANANFKKSKNLKGLGKEYEKVKMGIEKLLSKEVGEYFPEETKEKRVGRLSKKLEKLEEFQKELEALGDEEKRINMTDADAPVMRHKDGTSKPSYNHQSAADEKYGVVTAVETTQSGDNPDDLLKVVDASNENTEGEHENVSADCGFCSYDILEEVEERSEEYYVPDRLYENSKQDASEKKRYGVEDFTKDAEGNYICPAGGAMKYVGVVKTSQGDEVEKYIGTGCGEECPLKEKCTKAKQRSFHVDLREGYREKMREKLSSDKGRELYMKRQGLVEPLHGDDQKNKGWKQHHLRGLGKATGEFILMRIATNLAKIIKYKSDKVFMLALS